MGKLFELIDGGHVKPISPIHKFSFDDAPSAIRLLRAGKHIGKIVLSNDAAPKINVPVRTHPAAYSSLKFQYSRAEFQYLFPTQITNDINRSDGRPRPYHCEAMPAI